MPPGYLHIACFRSKITKDILSDDKKHSLEAGTKEKTINAISVWVNKPYFCSVFLFRALKEEAL